MSVIGVDVATVLALEEPAKALLEAIEKAEAAIDRLYKAKYPGAEWVYTQSGEAMDAHGGFGTVALVVEAVAMFRKAAGNPAADDYTFFVEYLELDLGEAAKVIIDQGGDADKNLRRVEAVRQYAATVA